MEESTTRREQPGSSHAPLPLRHLGESRLPRGRRGQQDTHTVRGAGPTGSTRGSQLSHLPGDLSGDRCHFGRENRHLLCKVHTGVRGPGPVPHGRGGSGDRAGPSPRWCGRGVEARPTAAGKGLYGDAVFRRQPQELRRCYLRADVLDSLRQRMPLLRGISLPLWQVRQKRQGSPHRADVGGLRQRSQRRLRQCARRGLFPGGAQDQQAR